MVTNTQVLALGQSRNGQDVDGCKDCDHKIVQRNTIQPLGKKEEMKESAYSTEKLVARLVHVRRRKQKGQRRELRHGHRLLFLPVQLCGHCLQLL